MDRNRLYNCLARVGKLIESPERVKILDALCQAERSVEGLSTVTELPVKTVSHHLQKLKKDHFVQSRKDGRFALYSVTDNDIVKFIEQLKNLTEHLFPEMQLALNEMRSERKLLTEVEKPVNPLLIDVRPYKEFKQAHIPGAVNIPFQDFEENMKVIPKETPVIAYCRDRFCNFADQAVSILIENGYNAWRIEDSVSTRVAEETKLEKGE